MVEYANVDLIEDQPVEQICDSCEDSQGPWYYYKPINEIGTYTICECCMENLQEVDEDA
jgi:hypothetical protein